MTAEKLVNIAITILACYHVAVIIFKYMTKDSKSKKNKIQFESKSIKDDQSVGLQTSEIPTKSVSVGSSCSCGCEEQENPTDNVIIQSHHTNIFQSAH